MARQSMRDEIVAAALEQFHIRGYHGAGVKDITDAAGVPKGSFYNHFDSKEALAVVALQQYGEGRQIHQLADRFYPAESRRVGGQQEGCGDRHVGARARHLVANDEQQPCRPYESQQSAHDRDPLRHAPGR